MRGIASESLVAKEPESYGGGDLVTPARPSLRTTPDAPPKHTPLSHLFTPAVKNMTGFGSVLSEYRGFLAGRGHDLLGFA